MYILEQALIEAAASDRVEREVRELRSRPAGRIGEFLAAFGRAVRLIYFGDKRARNDEARLTDVVPPML